MSFKINGGVKTTGVRVTLVIHSEDWGMRLSGDLVRGGGWELGIICGERGSRVSFRKRLAAGEFLEVVVSANLDDEGKGTITLPDGGILKSIGFSDEYASRDGQWRLVDITLEALPLEATLEKHAIRRKQAPKQPQQATPTFAGYTTKEEPATTGATSTTAVDEEKGEDDVPF